MNEMAFGLRIRSIRFKSLSLLSRRHKEPIDCEERNEVTSSTVVTSLLGVTVVADEVARLGFGSVSLWQKIQSFKTEESTRDAGSDEVVKFGTLLR